MYDDLDDLFGSWIRDEAVDEALSEQRRIGVKLALDTNAYRLVMEGHRATLCTSDSDFAHIAQFPRTAWPPRYEDE